MRRPYWLNDLIELSMCLLPSKLMRLFFLLPDKKEKGTLLWIPFLMIKLFDENNS